MMLSLYKTGRGGRLMIISVHDRQRSLLSPFALTVTRSLGGVDGADRLELFESQEEMQSWMGAFVKAKAKLGYRELYRYSRPGTSDPGPAVSTGALEVLEAAS